MEIEFDPEKAKANPINHEGVTFEEAKPVLFDCGGEKFSQIISASILICGDEKSHKLFFAAFASTPAGPAGSGF